MRRACGFRAFSLVDVLVSIAVIGVLMALLLPTLGRVRESTRRVICQSNLRQIGIGVGQYADENDDYLAPSVFYRDGKYAQTDTNLAEMMTLHLGSGSESRRPAWDGLGMLYSSFQLRAPEIFYCPSHSGNHPFLRYRDSWNTEDDLIVGNYQYRGVGPNNARRLRSIEPVRSAIVTDGLRTAKDVNHRGGMNVLRADLSISWYSDDQGVIETLLAASSGGEPTQNLVMGQVWRQIDGGLTGHFGGGGAGGGH